MDNKYISDNSGGGWGFGGGGGGAGIALLLLFLLILFAVFRGGFGGHGDGGYGGEGYGHKMTPADFEAWPQNIQRVPKMELLQTQQTGMLKETITSGDWALSKQISDGNHDTKIFGLQEIINNKSEKINALEMLLVKNDIEKSIGMSAAMTNSRLDGIECKMLEKPRVEALAGLHPAGIVNFPVPAPYPPYPVYPPYYPERDRDRDRDRDCCRPCFNV